MIASLPDACAKNGTARIAAITNTIAVVMSMDDAVAGACGLLDGSGVAPAPILTILLCSLLQLHSILACKFMVFNLPSLHLICDAR